MFKIHFEAKQHRLRVAGACAARDAGTAIGDAIDAFGRGRARLIVDLTAVTEITHDAAQVVLDSVDQLSPCRVTVLRKHGTEVDRVLSGASACSQGGPPE